MNLLKETIYSINDCGHEIKDIIFIGFKESGYSCTWDEFIILANHNYNNDHGAAEVASDLEVVFSDGSLLYRGEYDGSEWWEYRSNFKIPTKQKQIKSLFTGDFHWQNLDEIHSKLNK